MDGIMIGQCDLSSTPSNNCLEKLSWDDTHSIRQPISLEVGPMCCLPRPSGNMPGSIFRGAS